MTEDKTAKKTAKPSPRSGVALPISPGSHGGGKKGRSGRKPTAWRELCEESLTNAKAVEVAAKIISGDILEQIDTEKDGTPIYGDTRNADRLNAIKFLAEQVHGKPKETVSTTVTFKAVRE